MGGDDGVVGGVALGGGVGDVALIERERGWSGVSVEVIMETVGVSEGRRGGRGSGGGGRA